MTFRANFLIEAVTALAWMAMNLTFYLLIFNYTTSIGANTGWGRYEFFVFLATSLFVNSVVQAFFMPNANEFGELIRSGGLDFALLKPIDTQFLISLQKIEWSALGNFAIAGVLLGVSLWQLDYRPGWLEVLLYPFFIACGVAILYSLTIAMAAVGVWLGRNESLYDFWFYLTNFSRYPMEIYHGSFGTPLRIFFTFVVPVLVVVNVPARFLAMPLDRSMWWLAAIALALTATSLILSRWIFQKALLSYRSASS
ncbi:MAG: ABC-2 family transporter protein [Planctomycetaceae bacterium]|nr:ABC-2 family transporter protein [Planctomycetaceae bacterium]